MKASGSTGRVGAPSGRIPAPGPAGYLGHYLAQHLAHVVGLNTMSTHA